MLILFIYKLKVFRVLFSELDSVDLKFLDGCIVKRVRLPSAAAEKALGTFKRPARRILKKLVEKHCFQKVMHFTYA